MKIFIAYLEYNSQYLLTPDSHIRSLLLQRKMGRVRESEDRLLMEGCDGDTVSKVQSIASSIIHIPDFTGCFFNYSPQKSKVLKSKSSAILGCRNTGTP